MKYSSRAAVFAAFGVGPLLLAAGCGGTSDGAGVEATLLEIQPTSFVELPPATTTTTAPVPTNSDPDRASGAQDYTIRAGDTLGRIASRYDVELDALISFNEFADGVNQLILPGDVIKIPPGGTAPGGTESAGSDTGDTGDAAGDAGDTGDTANTGDAGDDEAGGDDEAAAPDDGEGCTHTIASGEFPNRVAGLYDITYEQLQAANPNMDMTTTFVVGDTLTIPPGADC